MFILLTVAIAAAALLLEKRFLCKKIQIPNNKRIKIKLPNFNQTIYDLTDSLHRYEDIKFI